MISMILLLVQFYKEHNRQEAAGMEQQIVMEQSAAIAQPVLATA